MSLCHSLAGGDILDDLSLEDVGRNDESLVSQPHNSTLVEEDINVELKDIIPLDLSAIMGEHLLTCLCKGVKIKSVPDLTQDSVA